ncbi:urease accessory protein UreD [Elioraea sp.]|uniref:urease accessory protein UreD n=1 Tax=Elioraea sp. TaxID=2185103 RepID=UPI003F719350
MSNPESPVRHQRNDGHVAVGFDAERLVRLDQRAPMRALFPDREPGEPPLATLVNTAGGLTGGDAIAQEIGVAAGSATVTTAAAEKVYRSLGPDARVTTRLEVAAGALLEWLPQETILFDGARLDRRLTMALAPGARLLAAEILVFGRNARGERYRRGRLSERWHVACSDRLLWMDALVLDGDLDARFASPFAFAGAESLGTLLVACDDPAKVVAALREAGIAATIARPGLALARWLGCGRAVRDGVAAAITRIRSTAFGLPPRLPRLWSC